MNGLKNTSEMEPYQYGSVDGGGKGPSEEPSVETETKSKHGWLRSTKMVIGGGLLLLLLVASRSQRQYKQPSVALVRTSSSTGAVAGNQPRPCQHTNHPRQRGDRQPGCRTDDECCDDEAVCVIAPSPGVGIGEVGICVIPKDCRRGAGDRNFHFLAECETIEEWVPLPPGLDRTCCSGKCLKYLEQVDWRGDQVPRQRSECGPVCIKSNMCNPTSAHTEYATCGEDEVTACCNSFEPQSDWETDDGVTCKKDTTRPRCEVSANQMIMDPNFLTCSCPVANGFCRFVVPETGWGVNCEAEVARGAGTNNCGCANIKNNPELKALYGNNCPP